MILFLLKTGLALATRVRGLCGAPCLEYNPYLDSIGTSSSMNNTHFLNPSVCEISCLCFDSTRSIKFA